jgi:hypothetical protein
MQAGRLEHKSPKDVYIQKKTSEKGQEIEDERGGQEEQEEREKGVHSELRSFVLSSSSFDGGG